MKRILILLLTLTLSLPLAACGGEEQAPGGSAVLPGADSAAPDVSLPEEEAPGYDAREEDPAESGGDDLARAAESETLFRLAGLKQMAENARVHDKDGILTDGENSLTPGIRH